MLTKNKREKENSAAILTTDEEFLNILHSVLISLSKHLEIVNNMATKLVTLSTYDMEYEFCHDLLEDNLNNCFQIISEGICYETSYSAPFLDHYFFFKNPLSISIPKLLPKAVYEQIEIICVHYKNNIVLPCMTESKVALNAIRTEIPELTTSCKSVMAKIYSKCFYNHDFYDKINNLLTVPTERIAKCVISFKPGLKYICFSEQKASSCLKLLYVSIVDINLFIKIVDDSNVLFPFPDVTINYNVKFDNWPKTPSSVTCCCCTDLKTKTIVMVYAFHNEKGEKYNIWKPSLEYFLIDDFNY